jgi:hypothetical protein
MSPRARTRRSQRRDGPKGSHMAPQWSRPPRYEHFPAPDGGHLVFDVETGQPADIGGHVLIGLSAEDAELVSGIMNAGKSPSATYLRQLRLPRG